MKEVKLADNIYYLGVNDRRTHLFENAWPLPYGVAYNSYLINDEKVALIDTVEYGHMEDFLERIDDILDGKTIDYLIINHMEPDHSGAIKQIVNQYPDIQIVGNKKTFPMLEGFFGIEQNHYEVEEGDTIDLGTHKLNFHMIPMVHWPETMVTYESTTQTLFSADAFGSFGTLDGGIFDDEINLNFFEDELRRYYSNIVGKYGNQVQKALSKLGGLEIKQIAATHGPIWRCHIDYILDKYHKWSSYEPEEEGAVIVFGSMYGNTEKMADRMARTLSENGVKNIRVYDASKTHASYIISDIWKYSGLIIGSAAYNGGIFPAVGSLIEKLKNMYIKNRALGIFGSSSWGGGGYRVLEKWAEELNLEHLGPKAEARCAPNANDMELCDQIATEVAQSIKKHNTK
ncbi:MAG: FprA family A-type flavoprotein [Salinivirgaceae bacterium]|jgi:flavorubredoxin|nr:FprA family A-type flavoprotein [Salinivirgaceae bacterium]